MRINWPYKQLYTIYLRYKTSATYLAAARVYSSDSLSPFGLSLRLVAESGIILDQFYVVESNLVFRFNINKLRVTCR